MSLFPKKNYIGPGRNAGQLGYLEWPLHYINNCEYKITVYLPSTRRCGNLIIIAHVLKFQLNFL